MVTSWIITFLLFYIQDFVLGLGQDTCYHERRDETYDCQFGCCGSTKEKECCDPMSMIIGISIGCVILVAAIIAAIVCCIKQHTRNTRRLQPRHNPGLMTVTQAKGPPAYPGLPYQSYPVYTDAYKGPIVQPPPSYQMNPAYAPPTYIPPEQQILYSTGENKDQPSTAHQESPGENSPPPPYTTH